MKIGISFFILHFVASTTHLFAWVPTSHSSRNNVSTLNSDAFPMRFSSYKTQHSMRFGSADEKETATTTPAATKMGNSRFPWANKNEEEAPIPTPVVPKQLFFFPWSAGKSNEISPLTEIIQQEEGEALNTDFLGAGAAAGVLAIVVGMYAAVSFDLGSNEIVEGVTSALQDPSAALDQVVQRVEAMGPVGALYFGVAYTIAEVLAIPAIPLTASAGYLFGPVEGTSVVLLSASIAASISFVIGRTLLRDYVEKVLEDYPKFAKLDKAIGKEGFKLMLVLRLSPIFPFALSNYLYGASSINFPAFFWGTLLGFTPGTIAYVCTGAFGKALQLGGDSNYPWYYYAGGLAILGGFIKVLADTASRVVEEMEEDD